MGECDFSLFSVEFISHTVQKGYKVDIIYGTYLSQIK